MAGYAWERTLTSVPDVQLDASGSIVPILTENEAITRHRLAGAGSAGDSIRRGVIRFVYLILDWSAAMDEDDFRPNRAEVVLVCLKVGSLRLFSRS